MRNFKSIVAGLCLGFTATAITATSAHATYWNVFNKEGEIGLSADIVTYDSLNDMLGDTNRTGTFTPNPGGFGVNIVGSGSDVPRAKSISEPSIVAVFGLGLAGLGFARRKKKTA